jgi:signal peptidase I
LVIDFAFYLVVAMAICGAIWALDALWWRRSRESSAGGTAREPVIVEYARSFFPIIVIVLVVRSFGFEPFRIPSGSMMPTLLAGDFIFVNKFVYGLRLPVTNTRVVPVGDPRRGDVVVFRLPRDPATNYIKRLVGLPGDTVVYRNRQLLINGEAVPVREQGVWPDAPETRLRVGLEQLGAHQHEVLWRNGGGSREGVFEVPDGYYFFMGDNRDNSTDSRYPEVGLVPEDLLVGKAVRIWMNWGGEGSGPDWGRIGKAIR